MVRLIRESEINPRHSYFTVIAMYYADDGAPSYLKGVVVHEVFDTGLPYDKQYYRGDTYFSEKSFYDEDEAYAYKNKLIKYGTPVSESIKRNKRRTMKEYLDHSDTIEKLKDVIGDFKYRSKNLNATQYDLLMDAYACFYYAGHEDVPEKEIFEKCRKFADHCSTHNKNLTKTQDMWVEYILDLV